MGAAILGASGRSRGGGPSNSASGSSAAGSSGAGSSASGSSTSGSSGAGSSASGSSGGGSSMPSSTIRHPFPRTLGKGRICDRVALSSIPCGGRSTSKAVRGPCHCLYTPKTTMGTPFVLGMLGRNRIYTFSMMSGTRTPAGFLSY